MSKRHLSRRYKDLVDWVKEMKGQDEATHSLAFILFDIYDLRYEGSIGDILKDLNEDLKLNSSNHLIPIIVDIYNDNYDIEEPEYYWKFNELKGFSKCDLYFGITLDTELLLIDVATRGTAKKCTKSELNDYLFDTNLTTDNFTPTEVLN